MSYGGCHVGEGQGRSEKGPILSHLFLTNSTYLKAKPYTRAPDLVTLTPNPLSSRATAEITYRSRRWNLSIAVIYLLFPLEKPHFFQK